MYKNILIATDGSDLGLKAVHEGVRLAKSLGAKAVVVTVTEPWTAVVPGEMGVAFPIDDYDKGCEAKAQGILAAAKEAAMADDVVCDILHVRDQFPAEGILEAARQRGADLIVMASHGRRGVSRLLLGSQANNVVTHSTLPVLIVR